MRLRLVDVVPSRACRCCTARPRQRLVLRCSGVAEARTFRACHRRALVDARWLCTPACWETTARPPRKAVNAPRRSRRAASRRFRRRRRRRRCASEPSPLLLLPVGGGGGGGGRGGRGGAQRPMTAPRRDVPTRGRGGERAEALPLGRSSADPSMRLASRGGGGGGAEASGSWVVQRRRRRWGRRCGRRPWKRWGRVVAAVTRAAEARVGAGWVAEPVGYQASREGRGLGGLGGRGGGGRWWRRRRRRRRRRGCGGHGEGVAGDGGDGAGGAGGAEGGACTTVAVTCVTRTPRGRRHQPPAAAASATYAVVLRTDRPSTPPGNRIVVARRIEVPLHSRIRRRRAGTQPPPRRHPAYHVARVERVVAFSRRPAASRATSMSYEGGGSLGSVGSSTSTRWGGGEGGGVGGGGDGCGGGGEGAEEAPRVAAAGRRAASERRRRAGWRWRRWRWRWRRRRRRRRGG